MFFDEIDTDEFEFFTESERADFEAMAYGMEIAEDEDMSFLVDDYSRSLNELMFRIRTRVERSNALELD